MRQRFFDKGIHRHKAITFCFFALVLFFSSSFSSAEKEVADFSLKNVNGKFISLKSYPDAKGFIVVFTCNHCPFAKLYIDRLNKLNQKFSAQHVPVIAIASPNTQMHEEDSYSEMMKVARQKKFTFPYLLDESQIVARDFAALRTPHAFVLWKVNSTWKIKYSGAVDDNGARPEEVKHPYIEEAVTSLLTGKEVEVKETKSIGCAIQWINTR